MSVFAFPCLHKDASPGNAVLELGSSVLKSRYFVVQYSLHILAAEREREYG